MIKKFKYYEIHRRFGDDVSSYVPWFPLGSCVGIGYLVCAGSGNPVKTGLLPVNGIYGTVPRIP